MSAHVLVFARRDAQEAIRVAAGLTIRNARVDLVFMTPPPLGPTGRIKNLEMLELAEIQPQSLLEETPDCVPCSDLKGLISKADHIVSF